MESYLVTDPTQHGPNRAAGEKPAADARRHLLDSVHWSALARSARTLRFLPDRAPVLLQLATRRRVRRNRRGFAGYAGCKRPDRLGTVVRGWSQRPRQPRRGRRGQKSLTRHPDEP